MDYEEALRFLESRGMFGMKLGLARMERFMEGIGPITPEAIHVAGTNGKGSVCAMLGSVLAEAGYRTGVYTSPHLVDVRERITVNGSMITRHDFAEAMEKVAAMSKGMGAPGGPGRPTYFEMLTALALLHFQKEQCDFIVMEAGMGGRLDATNVVEPTVSVITNVSLEHTEHLGGTVEAIAGEKAGIIKGGAPAVTGAKGVALEAIKAAAADAGSRIFVAENNTESVSTCLGSQTVKYKGMEINLPLAGAFQLENLNTALEVLELLKRGGTGIQDSAIKAGLEKTRWYGRLETVKGRPVVILDCSHNPAGAKALAASLSALGIKGVALLFGVMKDKDYAGMLECLMPLARKTVFTSPGTERAMDPSMLAAHFGKSADAEPDVKAALETAKGVAGSGGTVLVTGSIYLVGEVKKIMAGKRA